MPDPRRFLYRHRVRYDEVDRMGVIHHRSYVRYFENARVELLREADFPHRALEDSGVWFVVTGLEVSFKAAAGYDEEIVVQTVVGRAGGASVEFHHRVLHGDRLLATGRVGLACTDGKGAVTRLPARLRDVLRKLAGIVEN